MNDCIDELGNFSGTDSKGRKYEDGIMNNDLYSSEKIKILWILRETDGYFNPKDWWGQKKYLINNSNPFDSKNKKGSKRHTWEYVARITYQILNGSESNDDYELAACLERIAIINLKKTPGPKKINKEYYEYISDENNRKIFVEQIKRINPDVIICGNTLNHIKTSEINYRGDLSKTKHKLSELSSNKETMKKNSYFCFSNKLFINPYHPSYVMDKTEYVKIVVAAFQKWMKIKDNCPVFEW